MGAALACTALSFCLASRSASKAPTWMIHPEWIDLLWGDVLDGGPLRDGELCPGAASRPISSTVSSAISRFTAAGAASGTDATPNVPGLRGDAVAFGAAKLARS